MLCGFRPFSAHREQDQLLDRMLQQAKEGTVGVFDLDSCLFDPRHRQIVIFREFASKTGWLELYSVAIEDFMDWDLQRTMRNAGIPQENIQKHWKAFEQFWSYFH